MERRLNQSRELLQPLTVNHEVLEYLAGFFDVSGSVTIERNRIRRKSGRTDFSYVLRAELERVQAASLDQFKTFLPGYETVRTLPSGKVLSRWFVKATKAYVLLTSLGTHFRLKAGHWELIQEYIATSGQRTRDESEGLKAELMELNKNPEVSFANPLTDPYLAGVFDGHGSVGIQEQEGKMNLKVRIQLDQQAFMTEIGRTLKTSVFQNTSNGVCVGYVASLHSEKAARFLRCIQPYSIRHRDLIPAALSFQQLFEQNKGRRRAEEEYARLIAAKNLLYPNKSIKF